MPERHHHDNVLYKHAFCEVICLVIPSEAFQEIQGSDSEDINRTILVLSISAPVAVEK
jgi:hypothetical protein